MRTSRIAVIVLLFGVVLLAAEYVWLHARQESQAVAWANERVADKIEVARAHMAAQHWEEAIRHLEEARTIERATNRDEARPLLEQARRGQADALLEGAGLAVAHKDAANALRLLRAYLTHPQASDLERARLLREDLERATSGEQAARVLARASDDSLALFEKNGQLAEDDGLRTDGAKEIFKDTLRRYLAKELGKRQTKREVERLAAQRRAEERKQRIARLRAAPAFRDLSAFLARMRVLHGEQRHAKQRQEEELAQLFDQLDVNDKEEQTKIRVELGDGDGRPSIRKSVESKRAEVKRAYRSSTTFNADDAALFDRLVDEEVDRMLKELNGS